MLSITWFELRRMLSSRGTLINLFILPLLLIFILGNALSSSFLVEEDISKVKLNKVRMMVVTNISADDLAAQEALLTGFRHYLQQPELVDMVQPSEGYSVEEATEQLKGKQIDAALVFNAESQGSVQLMLGADSIANITASTIIDTFISEMNFRVAASSVVVSASRSAEGENTDGSMPSLPAITQIEESGSPLSYVNHDKLSDNNRSFSATQYFAATMMIMFLLYSGNMAISSLHQEKKARTLLRMQSTPVTPIKLFMGKMLGCSILALFQVIVLITFTTVLYDVYWGEQPLLLGLVCVLLIIASMSIAVIVFLLIRTDTGANSAMQTVIIIMTFISGGFTPSIGDVFQKLGLISFNYWGLQSILRIMLSSEADKVMPYVTGLAGISLVLLLMAAVLYRKVGYRYE